ncbi:glycine cleavage system protein GcvH [Microbulbifer agarilyticus]|uniref:glycine cleavage system protein GcvH n=1 Tax=Microbulbifer agarilyticus TaxID=260552 RepID=UPI001C96BE95|nr:glycine cleavage system protein GcvH [Microbulbifer agarilyticus]MBY6210827.1 glycine cleavage system protein GcvH [Microbulbifer agarilyticus]
MSNVKYTKSHEWFRAEGDLITVGITDFAQSQLGDVVFVELPEAERTLQADEEAAVIESVKAAGDISLPFAATVVEVNSAVEETPELVNEDPEGEGWFFRVRLEDPSALDTLMSAEEYAEQAEG